MDLVAQLMADFNYYRRHTRNVAAVRMHKGIDPPDLQATPERLSALRNMAVWCTARGIDPSLWLYTLFQSRKWMYAPKWEHLTPLRHVTFYLAANRLGFYDKRQRARRTAARAKAGELYDPNRDLSPSVESIKASYQRQGLSAHCQSRMREETLGFHPKSEVCAQCPLKQPCTIAVRASVPFDILALRAGRISTDDARRQADMHWTRALAPLDPWSADVR